MYQTCGSGGRGAVVVGAGKAAGTHNVVWVVSGTMGASEQCIEAAAASGQHRCIGNSSGGDSNHTWTPIVIMGNSLRAPGQCLPQCLL
jgi:hypothetical protein